MTITTTSKTIVQSATSMHLNAHATRKVQLEPLDRNMNTTTYGPFETFEEVMTDAAQRAPYVERAFQIVLTESAFNHMNAGMSINMPLDVLANKLAKQCGMVIRKTHPREWFYELEDERNVKDGADPLNMRDVMVHLVATLELFGAMQETKQERMAAEAAQRGRMCLKQRPHPISSLPYADRQRMAFNMRDFGSGFVEKLAHAWIHADMSNCRAIEEAFPHLFQKYDGEHWKKLREQRDRAPA